MRFDLIILGGGVAGTRAALLAVQKGLHTALVYDKPLGGVCLHEGCIPAKVCLENTFPDMASLSAYRNKTVDTLHRGLVYRLQESGIALFEGHGTYKKENNFSVQVGENTLTAPHLILATGSRSRTMPGALTAEKVFTMETLPPEVTIIGGGAAGLETASYLQKMGTAVTVLECAERLLPGADPEISGALLRGLRRRGIRIKLNAKVDEMPPGTVVCATGRETDPVAPLEGLYVAGDALGHHCTAHAAMREAECAVRRICGEQDAVDYNSIPNVVFTDPRCAYIGTTGNRAATVMLKGNGGYLAAGGDGTGILKLFAEDDTVCGMQICGGNAAELIGIGAVLVGTKTKIYDLARVVFPHPTVSEAIHTAAEMLCEGEAK